MIKRLMSDEPLVLGRSPATKPLARSLVMMAVASAVAPDDFSVLSDFLTAVPRVQVRFPRSKKKRIRKKWAKRPENFRPVFGYPRLNVNKL